MQWEKKKLYPINDLNQHKTRGHKQRINKTRSKTSHQEKLLSQRMVGHWNSLQDDVINAHSVNSFKHGLTLSQTTNFRLFQTQRVCRR